MINSKSKSSNTGYKGITLRKPKGRTPFYEVQLHFGKTKDKKILWQHKIYIGSYSDLKTAITEREEFIKKIF